MADNKRKENFVIPPTGGGRNKGARSNSYLVFILIAVTIIGLNFFPSAPEPLPTTWDGPCETYHPTRPAKAGA
jgi:uncharacterized membrane protein